MKMRFPRPKGLRLATTGQRFGLSVLLLGLLFTLLLPVTGLQSLFFPHYGLKFGPVAELQSLGLIYKSDSRGTYAVLDAHWLFRQPLAAGDRLVYRLVKPDQQEASNIELELTAKQGLSTDCLAAPQGCALQLKSSIRVPEEALASEYRLTAELLRPDGQGDGFNQPRLLRQLPENGFALGEMAVLLLLTLVITGSLLRYLAPVARGDLLSRILSSLLIANLTFLLLHSALVFRFGEFLVWSEYRQEQYYASWTLMVLGSWLSMLVGRSLYMGLMFTGLYGLVLLANFMKISIYGIPLGGNDLSNLGSLLQILREQYPLLPWLMLAGLIGLLWRFRLLGWLLRTSAVVIAFFGFSVFATQASNLVLGYNIKYFHNAVSYHRDIVRSGPSLYLFNLINDMVSGGTIFSYPVDKPSPASAPVATANPAHQPDWDVVIVMQYEALWLDWKGGICQQAPSLTLPDSVQQFHKVIHSPTVGGMTVLAEFEMNTGLPVGILRKGIVPYYYLNQHAPGLADTAHRQGYDTTFLHPYKEGFWGRKEAIPALGYQKRVFDDAFSAMDYKGLYVSDQAVVQNILKQVQSASRPQFIYTVTMQGHGPFNGPRYGEHELAGACPGLPDDERQILNNYYTGVVDAMASLQTLVEGLDKSGKRYLVLAFGDHQPYLMGAGKRVLSPNPKAEETFEIPFMAFSRADDAQVLQAHLQPVRQLFQAGQIAMQLLRGEPAHLASDSVLHPVLGMEKGFQLARFQQDIQLTFRPDSHP